MPMRLTRTTPINLSSSVTGKKPCTTAPETTYTCTASSCCSQESGNSKTKDHYVMSLDVAERLVVRTERKVQDFLDKSQWVKNHSNLADIPRFEASDLVMGKHLAEGGFSNIHEIQAFLTTNPFMMDSSSFDTTKKKKKKRYVVKHLKPELALNPYKLRSAAKDICNEIHVLSALDHPHIIQVKGLSSAGISGFAQTLRADSFFMVMERLDNTLLHKIPQWRQRGIRGQALSLNKLGTCPQTTKLFQDRLVVVQQLVDALSYLHERRILHRDIKPGNIAFDAEGELKLIDFGIAVELPETEDPNAVFPLGNAGTIRYQAPEVIRKESYNAKAETYSVCIVLWEIMSLTKPFEHLSCEEVKQSVTQVGCRPSLPRSWPKALRGLLKQGWSNRMNRRPSIKEVQVALTGIMEQDYSKRSFFGF